MPLTTEQGKTARTVAPTSVAGAGLDPALVRKALATPASNILSALLWLALLGVTAPQTFAQGGTPLWTNRYNGPGNEVDYASAVAVHSGNVFVTGFSIGDSPDYATVAYSGTGVPLWTNRYDGPGNYDDYAYATAVDSSGNVFVTGESYGSLSAQDYATIKYSSAGVPLWTNRYNGLGDDLDSAYAMAVDSSGNAIVTGLSYGDTNTYEDYVTIKYSSAGVALWTNRYDGGANGSDSGNATAVDSDGNVFVTGDSYNEISPPDYATIKYSSDGVPLWTNRYDGGADDYAYAMAVDSSGNVIVTGLSYGYFQDFATIKYSSAGVLLWINRYTGPGYQSDQPAAVAVDSSDNVFVTGTTYGGTNTLYDFVTIKYSSAGVPLCTNRYDGGGSDSAIAMAVDSSGNVIVTGYSHGGTNSFYDYATIAYSSAGVALWTNRYDGSPNAHDLVSAMAVDSSGNVFVTGADAYYDYLTIKYSSGLTPSQPPLLSIYPDGSGGLFINHIGVPDLTYRLQRAVSLAGPWSDVATNTAPASGLIEYHETTPPPSGAFYRAVQPVQD